MVMELIDSHAHLSYDDFDDVEAVLQRAAAVGVTRCITVGTDLEDSEKAIALTERFENVWCIIGCHPHDAQRFQVKQLAGFKELGQREKVLGFGEVGLDYHYDLSPRNEQRQALEQFMGAAQEVGKPVVIHCRNAMDDCMAILDDFEELEGRVLFHCFSGNCSEAKQILDRGFMISFSGIVTFKNALDVQKSAQYVPDDRFLIETDCPFLSPTPKRGQKPNEPALMVHTAAALGGLRNCSVEKIAELTTQNCRYFFGLDRAG